MKISLMVVVSVSLLAAYFVIFDEGRQVSDEETKDTSDVNQDNAVTPVIDPSVCKDNPEGYIYFQLGEEVFRYTKDSPIQISTIYANGERRLKRKIKDTNIPEGCEGNPYTGVIPKYEYKEGNGPIGNVKFNEFWVYELTPDRYSVVSAGQKLVESNFYRFKKKKSPCDWIVDGVERCIVPASDRPQEEWSVVYRADDLLHSTAVGKPFVLNCYKFAAAGLLCEAYYRLYPSIDIKYSFYPKRNNFDEKSVVKFDQYIRNIFENMRVKFP